MMEQITGRVTLHSGDCLDILPTLAECSIDSCVTDPPYGLSFMGRNWDHGVPGIPFWKEVYRTLKPGAHLAAFGGSRTYHRMACAIEDAGFEIRDSLCWIYATGFPKSHNISSHEKFCQCGAQSETERNLRCVSDDDVSSPEHAEPQRGEVLQSSVPQQNSHIKGAETTIRRNSTHDRIAQSVMEGWRDIPPPPWQLRASEICSMPAGIPADGAERRIRDGAPLGYGATLPPPPDADGMRASSGSQTATQLGNEPRTLAGQSQSQDGGTWSDCGRCGKPMVPDGLGTALKPAFEPIVLARKPLSESTVAANVLRWRTGALNIDGCRIGTEGGTAKGSKPQGAGHGIYGAGLHGACEIVELDKGRWPANVVHDGSAEVVAMFPYNNTKPRDPRRIIKGDSGADAQGNTSSAYGVESRKSGSDVGLDRGDSGSAARFFYSAKASKADRAGSKHPTVKPVSLMQWLCRLITPPGGTILDPFAGSGTTGAAARLEGFRAILIEREAEYQQDIRNRFAASADLLEAAE